MLAGERLTRQGKKVVTWLSSTGPWTSWAQWAPGGLSLFFQRHIYLQIIKRTNVLYNNAKSLNRPLVISLCEQKATFKILCLWPSSKKKGSFPEWVIILLFLTLFHTVTSVYNILGKNELWLTYWNILRIPTLQNILLSLQGPAVALTWSDSLHTLHRSQWHTVWQQGFVLCVATCFICQHFIPITSNFPDALHYAVSEQPSVRASLN